MEDFKKRNKNRFFAWFLLALVLAGSFCVSAAAADTVYSIYVICRGWAGKEIVSLAGDTYALVQVAEGQVSGETVQYTTLPKFAEFDCVWEDLTDSQSQKKAAALETVAKAQSMYDRTGITDQKGTVTFDGLAPGVYLLMRIQTAKGNDDFICDPILYQIPTFVNHQAMQRMVATPKMVWIRGGGRPMPGDPDDPGSPESSQESQETKLPQTGQTKWPIPILMLAGMGFFFAGFTLEYGGAWDDEEE